MKNKEIKKLGSIIMSVMKSILLFYIIVANTSAIAQKIENKIETKLDSIVINSAIDFDIPGVSVGIVKNMEVIYLKNYGVKNVITQEPVSSGTIFNMGSISKVFTATAIMQLFERGLVDISTPVHKYVPYFSLKNQNYKKITVEHLLTHSSGLPGDHSAYRGKPYFGDDAIKKYIISLYDRDIEFTPGEKYSYSNTGFVLLSALIEEVTKTKFEEYMWKNLLEPMGMENSTFDANKKGTDNLTARHVIGPDFSNAVLENDPGTRWNTGAGGLSSNVNDMCLFAQTLINNGSIGNNQILSKKSLEMMWKKKENTGDKGFAWSVYNVWDGKKLVDHGGNSIGYSAELALMPDDSLAVIVFCNNRNGAEWPIAGAILKTILGIELRKPKYYPDYYVQKKLREEGPDSALLFLRKTLDEDKDEVSCYDMMLLAYRVIQGGGEKNLEISKTIYELLAEYFPDNPMVNDMLGEIYFKLAIKQYRELIKKDPTSWTGKKMLELLENVNIDFY